MVDSPEVILPRLSVHGSSVNRTSLRSYRCLNSGVGIAGWRAPCWATRIYIYPRCFLGCDMAAGTQAETQERKRSKVCAMEEVVALFKDGDSIIVSGFCDFGRPLT